MLEIYKRGDVTLSNIVERMCHAPAVRYKVRERGFIREGYYADLLIADMNSRWQVLPDNILYKCGWSPFEEEYFTTRVTHTIINGEVVYEEGKVNETFRGKALEFDR